MGKLFVGVRSLVDEPKNVVSFEWSDFDGSGRSLLSPREARKLAEMLVDAADQADELPTHTVM